MIQNFNPAHSFEKNNLEPDYSYKGLSLALKLDSDNKVYSFAYKGADELSPYFDFIGEFVLNRALDEFKDHIAQMISTFARSKDLSWDQWKASEALLQFQFLLKKLTGREHYSPCEADKIICRCFKKDLQQIYLGHEDFKGLKNDYLKDSLVGSGCSQCKTVFDQLWSELDKASIYFKGKTPLEMTEEVKNHLASFKDYSAQDLSELELRNIYFESDTFVFEFTEKKDFNFNSLQNSLINYLSSHFGFGIKLRFTFLS